MNISADATSTSQRLLKSPKRPSAAAAKVRTKAAKESEEQTIKTEESSRSTTLFTSRKRKYTPSALDSPVIQPALVSRSSTFNSVYDLTDSSSTIRWTKQHWKRLEKYYIERNRDYKRAADAFYYLESLITIDLPQHLDGREPETKELWSKDEITWRCQCLDTSAKVHNGLLPSERKRIKKRRLSNSTGIPGLFKSPSAMSITTASSSKSSTPNRTPNSTPNRTPNGTSKRSTLSFTTTTTPTRNNATVTPSFESSTSFSTHSQLGNNNTPYQSSSSSSTR